MTGCCLSSTFLLSYKTLILYIIQKYTKKSSSLERDENEESMSCTSFFKKYNSFFWCINAIYNLMHSFHFSSSTPIIYFYLRVIKILINFLIQFIITIRGFFITHTHDTVQYPTINIFLPTSLLLSLKC
jgi:serine acetyltransferase